MSFSYLLLRCTFIVGIAFKSFDAEERLLVLSMLYFNLFVDTLLPPNDYVVVFYFAAITSYLID